MARTINEIMTHDPRTVQANDPIVDAARHMREGDVGALVVLDDGQVTGIVTDRDITVRAVADGRDPRSTTVREVSSGQLECLSPDQTVDDAVRIMRERNVRRVPVVQNDRPVGIVSLGDLAVERDPQSALADISAGDPNR